MSVSRPHPTAKKTGMTQKVGPSVLKKRQNHQTKALKIAWLTCAASSVLFLAAVYSPISQLSLSPVYGSVPAGAFHGRGMTLAILTGWFGKDRLKGLLSARAINLLPLLAFSIPTIQHFLFMQSTRLGALLGPLVTELFTFYPLVVLSVFAVAVLLEDADLRQHGKMIADYGPFLGSCILFMLVQKAATSAIPKFIGSSIVLTRAGLQFATASLYAMLLPSKWLLLTIPSLLFSARFNVHVPLGYNTALLNSTLQTRDYVLIDRQESLTGYMSVLENTKEGFRVLRCDHSLLGGEWTRLPATYKPQVQDPVYSVFAMLEAVRLIKSDDGGSRRADSDSNALVIGLGVGTTPAALITHGINTTVVEIDPMVHRLATKYFSLPDNFTAVIQDAVSFVRDATKVMPSPRFDYIIHDVFTGGAEPVDLFTVEFMKNLHGLLKGDGVVAINYAGDLALPSAGLVVRTVQSVFPSCRIFRESERPSDADREDFMNMVIFCKKTESFLHFRQPVETDFLGSKSRESYLYPKIEIDPEMFAKVNEGKQHILAEGRLAELQMWQSKSAVGHWIIMRKVLPAAVWENW